MSIALAIGRWDDDSKTDDRTCFGIEVSEEKEDVHFRVMEPSESPWSNTDLLGPMVARNEGLSHPLLQEVFEITEKVLRDHIELREYFAIPEEKKFIVKH